LRESGTSTPREATLTRITPSRPFVGDVLLSEQDTTVARTKAPAEADLSTLKRAEKRVERRIETLRLRVTI
jgi:hypothetical protein